MCLFVTQSKKKLPNKVLNIRGRALETFRIKCVTVIFWFDSVQARRLCYGHVSCFGPREQTAANRTLPIRELWQLE